MSTVLQMLESDRVLIEHRRWLASRDKLATPELMADPVAYRAYVEKILKDLTERIHDVLRITDADIMLRLCTWHSSVLSDSLIGVLDRRDDLELCFPSGFTSGHEDLSPMKLYSKLSDECRGSIAALIRENRVLSKWHLQLRIPRCYNGNLEDRQKVVDALWVFRSYLRENPDDDLVVAGSGSVGASALTYCQVPDDAKDFLYACLSSMQACWFFEQDNWSEGEGYTLADLCELAVTQLVTGSAYWSHVFFLGADTKLGLFGALVMHAREDRPFDQTKPVSLLRGLADSTGDFLLALEINHISREKGFRAGEYMISHEMDTPISVLNLERAQLSNQGKLAVDYLELWRRQIKREWSEPLPAAMEAVYHSGDALLEVGLRFGYWRAVRRSRIPKRITDEKLGFIAFDELFRNIDKWLDVSIDIPEEILSTQSPWAFQAKTWLMFHMIGACYHVIAFAFEKCGRIEGWDSAEGIRKSRLSVAYEESAKSVVLTLSNTGGEKKSGHKDANILTPVTSNEIGDVHMPIIVEGDERRSVKVRPPEVIEQRGEGEYVWQARIEITREASNG